MYCCNDLIARSILRWSHFARMECILHIAHPFQISKQLEYQKCWKTKVNIEFSIHLQWKAPSYLVHTFINEGSWKSKDTAPCDIIKCQNKMLCLFEMGEQRPFNNEDSKAEWSVQENERMNDTGPTWSCCSSLSISVHSSPSSGSNRQVNLPESVSSKLSEWTVNNRVSGVSNAFIAIVYLFLSQAFTAKSTEWNLEGNCALTISLHYIINNI